ncbi:MAG: hypothetical protein MI757_03885 [Pirellulales bacterium]|nr:hypothetical protein [Pirellulales bacterium]
MEDVRDLEFEKLRIAERALMPQVAEGDHNAIRLLLRIIELRKRYLKDLPYENIKDDPHFELLQDDEIPGCEDDYVFEEEPVSDKDATDEQAGEEDHDEIPQTEAERAIARQASAVKGIEWYLANELTSGTPQYLVIKQKLEVEKQKLLALEAVLEKERSTEASKGASTSPSKSPSTDWSTQGASHDPLPSSGSDPSASSGAFGCSSQLAAMIASASERAMTQSRQGAKDRKGKK